MRLLNKITILFVWVAISIVCVHAQSSGPGAPTSKCGSSNLNSSYIATSTNTQYLCTTAGWTPNIGIGIPIAQCSAVNYGNYYTDVSGSKQYSCGVAGWFQIGGGGGGSPGGSNQQIQYNNNGAFGGATGSQTDGLHWALGVGATVDNPDPAYFDTSTIVNVQETSTSPDGRQGLVTGVFWNPATAVASGDGSSGNNAEIVVNMDGQFTANTTAVAENNIAVSNGNTTALDSLVGQHNYANNVGNTNITHLWGQQSFAENFGTGSVSSDMIGSLASVRTHGGTINLLTNFYADLSGVSGGHVGEWDGLFIPGVTVSGGGSITNAVGIHINAISGATNNWGIKIDGLSTKNEFAGPFINDTVATSPSTAPICPSGTGGAFTTTGCVAGAVAPHVYTVSTLPLASSVTAGTMVIVSDASTFTVGTCTGGGSDYMIAVSNSVAWSCH